MLETFIILIIKVGLHSYGILRHGLLSSELFCRSIVNSTHYTCIINTLVIMFMIT